MLLQAQRVLHFSASFWECDRHELVSYTSTTLTGLPRRKGPRDYADIELNYAQLTAKKSARNSASPRVNSAEIREDYCIRE